MKLFAETLYDEYEIMFLLFWYSNTIKKTLTKENEFNFANDFKKYGSNNDQAWIALNYHGAIDPIEQYKFCNGINGTLTTIQVSDVRIGSVSLKQKLGL